MDFAAATALDFRLWPQREDVTYLSAASGGYSSFPLTYPGGAAKRRGLTFKEMAGSGGAYTGQDRVWLVPAAVLPTVPTPVTPKPADQVLDGTGVAWTVLQADAGKYGQTWRLTTRNLILALGLRDTVSLLRAANPADPGGMRVPTYAAVEANVPARVQETDAGAEDRQGKRQAVRRFACTVGRRVYPRASTRSGTRPGGRSP